MSSRGRSSLQGDPPATVQVGMPADVEMMRTRLEVLLRTKQAEWPTSVGSCKWGVYAFYDFYGEPIYVGQTRESLGTRVRRHLTNQRTDSVAMRILDPMEVAEVELWPLWNLASSSKEWRREALLELDGAEHAAYQQAIRGSRFEAILNEKIPPVGVEVELGESCRATLYEGETLERLRNADVRIARRAESVSRLADVARERGAVTPGLRRVIVIQAIRLAFLAAERLATAEGREGPEPSAIDSRQLFGRMLPDSDPDRDPDADIEAEG